MEQGKATAVGSSRIRYAELRVGSPGHDVVETWSMNHTSSQTLETCQPSNVTAWYCSSEQCRAKHNRNFTTFSNGYLGSRNDEERSEMRYVMRIAEFSESSKF